ncbi:MAG: protein kinase [Caldimonas sp.]
MTDGAYPDALPAGHRLHWYVIERVLGQGGFGITYLARDPNLDRHVAIKEYLPTEIARRRADASARPRTESHGERYALGLERFLSEARTLARFDHRNIVRVHSVFEANNTAYMVMRFEEGEDLATRLHRCGTLSETELTEFLLPIMDGLELVHATGFIHRDIKPENIYVRQDGSPVLLDFGSARQSFGNSKTMTILVAPGYAPLEQYYGDASTQGPWTDIYGLAATCYRAIAGNAPLDAVARAKGVLGSARDMLTPATEAGQGRYGERLLAAVDRALQLSERDRPQGMAEWRRDIVGPRAARDLQGSAIPVVAVPASARAAAPTAPVVAHDAAPMHAPAGSTSSVSTSTTPTISPAAKQPHAFTPWATAVLASTLVGIAVYFVAAPRPLSNPTPPPVASVPARPAVVPSTALALPATATNASPPSSDAAPPVPTATTASSVVTRLASTRPAAAVVPSARPPPVPGPPPSPESVAPTTVGARPAALGLTLASTTPTVAMVSQAPSPGASTSVTETLRQDPVTRRRDEQLDAADAALRRGDSGAAAQILAPLAAAGVTRAQAMLGRTQEARTGSQRSDFEAYVWYGVAARGGEPGAQSMKDKVAARLQPAEIRQAEKIVEHWKPRVEDAAGSNP